MIRTRKCRTGLTLLLAFLIGSCTVGVRAQTPCPEAKIIATGLLGPSKIIQIPSGRFLVPEVGPPDQTNASRVSIVDPDGARRTLLDGLPSAQAYVGDPSGATALWLQGRTLYIVNGQGDSTLAGPVQGTEWANPTPASPIFSSVLAMDFPESLETNTANFKLVLLDHQTLKSGAQLALTNIFGDKTSLRLVVDFADYLPEPRAIFPENVRHSNAYGIVGDATYLYIVDAGFNSLRKVDIATGQDEVLTSFPSTPSPLTNGPPFIENVPTSIHWVRSQLMVTLFGGAPFLPGLSKIVQVDPGSGVIVPLVDNLTTAIDSAPLAANSLSGGVLALEYDLAFPKPGGGRLQSFTLPFGNPVTQSDCLITPSSMLIDRNASRLILSELSSGRLISIPAPRPLPLQGYLYFSEFAAGRIGRINLDGNSKVTLVSGLSNPVGPSLNPGRGQMLWGDSGTATMRSANLDGSGLTNVVSSPNGGMPALDLASGRMYWSVSSGGSIRRANLDGSVQEILVTGLNDPHAPALDAKAGQLYWPNFGSGEIQRINVDGTEHVTLIRNLGGPSLLTLELAGRKIYWSNRGTGDIRRANFDGTGQEILIRGQNLPAAIAVDAIHGHIYWGNAGSGEIRRANLEGTEIQTVVNGLQGPSYLTLDLAALPVLKASLEIRAPDPGYAVAWNALLGRAYAVQFNAGLNQSNWIMLLNRVTATNTTMRTVDASVAENQRFYRIQLLPK